MRLNNVSGMVRAWQTTPSTKRRARGLGLRFDGMPGPYNSITDIQGVGVGYTTIIEGSGRLSVGSGPVRTGVTAILPRPHDRVHEPVLGGYFSLNGNGELTGSHFLEETGRLALPITITNTHSCGTTRDATIRWAADRFPDYYHEHFALPVAAETYDGFLNDINGFHVKEGHVSAAIDGAGFGWIDEGSVGGGTGMKCFGFKAGSGTSSRLVDHGQLTFTVGAFVQANFGHPDDLTILGHRLAGQLGQAVDPTPIERSSIIIILATDAPMLPHQLKRLARRATFGVGRTGGIARHGSGDIFLAFSTANNMSSTGIQTFTALSDEDLDPFFEAAVQVVEEAILNSLIANEAMTGRDDHHVPALPHDRLQAALGL